MDGVTATDDLISTQGNQHDSLHINNSNENKKKRSCIQVQKPFQSWKIETINIRSGKQKDEGAKMYSITKEVARTKLELCCIQEVKYRNSGKKIIYLDSGESYEFHWSGNKKRRTAGVGFLIKVDPGITIKDPDVLTPRIIATNIVMHGFSIRLVNAYSPTNCEESENQKDIFNRELRKAVQKQEKNQKFLVVGDFNAETSLGYTNAILTARDS